jgi:hypothetical protein
MLFQIVMTERKDSEIIEAEILFRDKMNKSATPKGIKFIIKYFFPMLS